MSRRIQQVSLVLLLFLSGSASAWLNHPANGATRVTHRSSTPSSDEALTAREHVYDAKKIRNFSIIAHIDHGTYSIKWIPVCWIHFSDGSLKNCMSLFSIFLNRQIDLGGSIARVDKDSFTAWYDEPITGQHGLGKLLDTLVAMETHPNSKLWLILGAWTWNYHQATSRSSIVHCKRWRNVVSWSNVFQVHLIIFVLTESWTCAQSCLNLIDTPGKNLKYCFELKVVNTHGRSQSTVFENESSVQVMWILAMKFLGLWQRVKALSLSLTLLRE